MWGWLRAIGRFAKRALGLAQSAGLTDDLIQRALELVKVAAAKFDDNTERREWVLVALLALKVPESVARLAIELAVTLWKRDKA